MKIVGWVRRYRWTLLILLTAGLAWWLAFEYLVELRPPDVPYVDTPHDVVAAMLDLANVTSEDTVYDLGSGDGRIVIAAGKRGAKAVGLEIDPALANQSSAAIRAAGLADRVEIVRGDMFKRDLTPATVVTMYLKPQVNAQLRPQLDRLRPGTRIVSHQFSMPGAVPAKKITMTSSEDGIPHDIYLWVAPIEWK